MAKSKRHSDFRERDNPLQDKCRPNLIPGFHAIKEAMEQGRLGIKEIWISKGKDSNRTREILLLAGMKRIPINYKDRRSLDNLIPDTSHQGFVALTERFRYTDLDNLIRLSVDHKDNALLIGADHITDEGNLGALIRSAAYFGAHGLFLPKDRAAGVTERVMKRSSGAYLHLPIARVVNMGRALDILEKNEFWIIGAAGRGTESIYTFNWDRPLALILGSEEKGLSNSAIKRCHQLIRIPGTGNVESLNVSVACGVFLSEITRRRKQG